MKGLYYSYHYVFYNFFISLKINPIFFGSFFLLYHHSQCKTLSYILSLQICLFQAFLRKLINHTMGGLLRCISFICQILKIYSCLIMNQCFILCCDQIITHYMGISHLFINLTEGISKYFCIIMNAIYIFGRLIFNRY